MKKWASSENIAMGLANYKLKFSWLLNVYNSSAARLNEIRI